MDQETREYFESRIVSNKDIEKYLTTASIDAAGG
jgi:hypothetical protein